MSFGWWSAVHEWWLDWAGLGEDWPNTLITVLLIVSFPDNFLANGYQGATNQHHLRQDTSTH